jgi:predicted ArsR family transcriptional regulator
MPSQAPHSSRERILIHLRQHGEATASQIAKALGLSSETVRHHLRLLEREGLVRPPERRPKEGRGRPSHSYHLAPAAHVHLPHNYAGLLTHLVAMLSQSMDEEALRALLADVGHHYAASVGSGWPVSATSRRSLTMQFLESAGYLPQWDTDTGEIQLRFGHCPYSPLSQAQPGLCTFDEALLGRLLGRRIQIAGSIARFERECLLLVGKTVSFDSLLAF